MMFHCNSERLLNMKRLEIVANEELLFPAYIHCTLFSTAELLFESSTHKI